LTGTSRPTATTSGTGDRSPPGVNRGSTPGGVTVMRSGEKWSRSTISALEECDRVTIRLRRYRGGAIRCSSTWPNSAMPRGRTIFHISAWTWWRKVICGLRDHTGLKNGMPFQISTTPSPVPMRPTAPDRMERGNTEYLPARRMTR